MPAVLSVNSEKRCLRITTYNGDDFYCDEVLSARTAVRRVMETDNVIRILFLIMITDLNHITLSVSDLDRSFSFYTERLGVKPHAIWARGAYLSAGNLWLCLSLDVHCRAGTLREYTHIAFSVPDAEFPAFCKRLVDLGVPVWKNNSSEGDSLYILDPDGHKLAINVGNLQSRLDSLKERPYDWLVLF